MAINRNRAKDLQDLKYLIDHHHGSTSPPKLREESVAVIRHEATDRSEIEPKFKVHRRRVLREDWIDALIYAEKRVAATEGTLPVLYERLKDFAGFMNASGKISKQKNADTVMSAEDRETTIAASSGNLGLGQVPDDEVYVFVVLATVALAKKEALRASGEATLGAWLIEARGAQLIAQG